jgi:hypothetical protein
MRFDALRGWDPPVQVQRGSVAERLGATVAPALLLRPVGGDPCTPSPVKQRIPGHGLRYASVKVTSQSKPGEGVRDEECPVGDARGLTGAVPFRSAHRSFGPPGTRCSAASNGGIAVVGGRKMKRSLTPFLVASLLVCVAATAGRAGTASRGSGVRVTPDGAQTLINKDVGSERWAITRSDDGTVTGNVFFADGRDPVFLFCTETDTTATDVTLSCDSAAGCAFAPCPPSAWTFVADATLPLSFFEPPGPVIPSGPLGRRRFSIDPSTSGQRSLSTFGPADTIGGFNGWIELEGSAIDPSTGLGRIDVVDASPLITLDGFANGAGPVVICIEPDPDQFPVIGAGVIDCDGGTAFGYSLAYDHDIGVVGLGGFTADQCTAAGGVVEDAPHAGVCNSGPVVGTSTADTGPGGLIIAELAQLANPGFQVSITTETALPCGDEGPPVFEGALPLTTGQIVTTLDDVDTFPGSQLRDTTVGSNFSCNRWTEDGPGTLTLASVSYDLAPAGLGGLTLDIISTFVFDD